MASNRNKESLIGKTFGKWFVISPGIVDEYGNHMWLCRCECGRENNVIRANLLAGRSRSCVVCANLPQEYNDEFPDQFWKVICKRASRAGKEFGITKDYAYRIFLRQNKLCVLSGIPIEFAKTPTDHLRGKTSASLDRIDNNFGYLPGNVQWVHKDVNRMKNIFDESYFITICKKIAAFNTPPSSDTE